jgi:hypothetical protein
VFDSFQKPAEVKYTPIAALLVLALVFSPAILMISGPLGYLSVSLAMVFSVLCMFMAWTSWKRSLGGGLVAQVAQIRK